VTDEAARRGKKTKRGYTLYDTSASEPRRCEKTSTATVGVGKKTNSASKGVFEEAFFFTPPPVFVV
jgi:hypothetical protein